MSEPVLAEHIIFELQERFRAYQHCCFFIKLGKCKANTSEISWIKIFPDLKSMEDFFWDSSRLRASIMIRFDPDHAKYHILVSGHSYSTVYEVWADWAEPDSYWEKHEYDFEVEATPLPPRELVEDGFGDLTGILASSGLKVAK